MVLAVQVIDISCWWLARLDGVGPYFAMAILVTGGLVALGLSLQIILSLFNMYGGVGKTVLVLLFAAGAAGAACLYLNVLAPTLKAEKEAVQKSQGAGKATPQKDKDN
jgi:hypothetical protein